MDDDDDDDAARSVSPSCDSIMLVCVTVCVCVCGLQMWRPVNDRIELTSADSQERRVNGACESVPSPNDEAKHHEDKDDGPRHSHHSNDDDGVLFTGYNCSW